MSWVILGLTVRHAFPLKLAESLLKYTFSGFFRNLVSRNAAFENSSSKLWEAIVRSASVLPSLEDIPATGNVHEARELNKLDSQFWLLICLADTFRRGSQDSEPAFWKVKELEEQRLFVLSRLKPLKEEYYQGFVNLQRLLDGVVNTISSPLKSSDQTDIVLDDLIVNHLRTDSASELEVQELLEVLEKKLVECSDSNSLYKVWRLLSWTSSVERNILKIETVTESSVYSDCRVRAIVGSPKYHVLGGCHRFPKVERPGDEQRIQFFPSTEAAEENLKMCRDCEKKLRDPENQITSVEATEDLE